MVASKYFLPNIFHTVWYFYRCETTVIKSPIRNGSNAIAKNNRCEIGIITECRIANVINAVQYFYLCEQSILKSVSTDVANTAQYCYPCDLGIAKSPIPNGYYRKFVISGKNNHYAGHTFKAVNYIT